MILKKMMTDRKLKKILIWKKKRWIIQDTSYVRDNLSLSGNLGSHIHDIWDRYENLLETGHTEFWQVYWNQQIKITIVQRNTEVKIQRTIDAQVFKYENYLPKATK